METINQGAKNQCFDKAGLAVGTTSTYTTTAAVAGTIKGKFAASFATKTTQATPTTDARTGLAFNALAASQGCVFVFCFNVAAEVKVCQGPIQGLDAANNFKVAPEFPQIPDILCPFGYMVVKNASTGSAWLFGTTNWAVTGQTEAVVDVGTLPDRPQVA